MERKTKMGISGYDACSEGTLVIYHLQGSY